MASKADLLKKSVNKTGKGLFAGMTPIKEETENKEKQKSIEENAGRMESQYKEIEKDAEKEIVEVIDPKKETALDETKVIKENKTEPSPREMVEEILRQNSGTKEKKTITGEKQEKTSRYEKEKFLLLDIRGYRDYVEHMAKAANMSATKYIRSLIEQDMEQNMDIYEAHKALEERLKRRK